MVIVCLCFQCGIQRQKRKGNLLRNRMNYSIKPFKETVNWRDLSVKLVCKIFKPRVSRMRGNLLQQSGNSFKS